MSIISAAYIITIFIIKLEIALMTNQLDIEDYLKPGVYIDSDSPEILAFVRDHAKGDSPREKAVSLFFCSSRWFLI